MKLPPSISICGIPYKIVIREMVMREGSCRWGEIDYGNQTINISKCLEDGSPRPAVSILETLIHEILHGTFEHCEALDAIVPDADDKQEQLIRTLATILAATLIDAKLIKG